MANVNKEVLILKALADETRIKILKMIGNGEISAKDILGKLKTTQPALSYHMKLLTESGLVKVRRESTWAYYSLNQPVAKAFLWSLMKVLTPPQDKA